MVHNLSYLTTDQFYAVGEQVKTGYIKTKEMELKKGYGDSFNNDLFELHAFTQTFTKSIQSVSAIIKKMHEKKQQ